MSECCNYSLKERQPPLPPFFGNAPQKYTCPFCLLAGGFECSWVSSRRSDMVLEDERLMAFICARQWPNNKGHVLVVPRRHYENIYDLPVDLGGEVHAMARRIAIAMKYVYRCDGISTRQHNELHGGQEVWHYHLHVFPRYADDRLYETKKGVVMPVEERAEYAELLRFFLADGQQTLPEIA